MSEVSRSPNAYCPRCAVDGNANHPFDCDPDGEIPQPVQSVMGVLFVEGGKPATRELTMRQIRQMLRLAHDLRGRPRLHHLQTRLPAQELRQLRGLRRGSPNRASL